MSHINSSISNEEVIPVIESGIFQDRPDARFAVGVIAVGNCVAEGLENEYRAYYDLRRAVYLDQTGQLSPEDIDADGTDRDEDDTRSVAFGVIENRGIDQRLVAVSRLIIKGLAGVPDNIARSPLPIEKEWPELFAEKAAPETAFEVSRLISRHESAAMQALNKSQLITAELSFVRANKLGPAYAIVEEWLERDLKRFVPAKRMGDPKYVEHYLDVNVPLEVDVPEFVQHIETKSPGTLDAMPAALGEVSYYGTLKKEQLALASTTLLKESA